jgi:hypothetical protein
MFALAMTTGATASAAKSWKVGGLLYKSRSVEVPAGGEGSGLLPCGTRTIVAGGVATSGPAGKSRISGLSPDGPNNSWFAFVDVFGSRARSFQSFAVCSKGAFTHEVADHFPVAPGQIGLGLEICGAGEAVGGGVATLVGYGESRVIESTSASSSSWSAAWRNTSDTSENYQTHVTCKQGWNVRRVRVTEKLKPKRKGAATASCRRREHVVGGGAAVTTDDLAYLATSRPIDDGDEGGAPDDGWRAVLHSASDTPAQMEALAICRRPV